MSWNAQGGAKNFAVITPHDTNEVNYPEYLHVAQAGNLVVHNKNGVAITLAVAAGFVFISPKVVLATGSTVGQVVGFWGE